MDFDRDIVTAYFALKRIARQFCPNEAADDLAAEAITRALEHRQSYNPAFPLLVWCRVIMRNLWINTEQKLETRQTVHIGMRDAVGYTATDQQAIMGDITAVIDALCCKSVSVATLMDFANGYSLAEIAEARGVPLGTAKRRIHDGREMLSKALTI